MYNNELTMELKETHAKIGQIMQRKINEYDLRIGLLYVAILVKNNPGYSQKELAEKMRFTQGAMSHSVKILINKDILKQIPLESDMRYNRLVVTEKGERFIEDYEEYIKDVYRKMFVGFGDEELKVLKELLSRINSNIERIDNELD